MYAKLEKEEDFEAWKGKLKGSFVLVAAPMEIKDEDVVPLARYDDAELSDLGKYEIERLDEKREEW